MADWIKIVGSIDQSYDQRVHDGWNQRHVWFPNKSPSIQRGDRLFLYTGHPLRRFFALCLVLQQPLATLRSRGKLQFRAEVFTQLCLQQVSAYGVESSLVFPLPSGQAQTALRQKSHVSLQPGDAHFLVELLSGRLKAELLEYPCRPIQVSILPETPRQPPCIPIDRAGEEFDCASHPKN